MTSPSSAGAEAKRAMRDRLLEQLAGLGCPPELAIGAVELHVRFDFVPKAGEALAVFDAKTFLDSPEHRLDLARLLADAHCGVPLARTSAATPTASPLAHHQRQIASSF